MTRQIHCRLALLEEGWRHDVCLKLDDDGVINSVTPDTDPDSAEELAGITLPGMPNLHSHGFQRLMAGLSGRRAGGDSFWTWRKLMYDFANRISPDQLSQCMAGVYMEMLKGGYTSVAEFHYLHHDHDGSAYAQPEELSLRVLNAASEVGMGITLLPVLYRRSGFGAEGHLPAQRRFVNTPDAYLSVVDACEHSCQEHQNVGLALHSLRAVNEREIEAVLEQRRPDQPIHIHVAEQPEEVHASVRYLDARPLEWLLNKFPIDQHWCLVHATHLNDEEIVRGAATGAVAGLCPSTESDLGDGIFSGPQWKSCGGRFGIGSDSNLRLEVAEELRTLEFSQRLQTGERNVLATEDQSVGRWLYENAASGGAQALGQNVGKIAPGHRADLVELDAEHPLLEGLTGDQLLDSYVFSGGRDMIASVWVAGTPWVVRGNHRSEAKIAGEYRQLLSQIRS